MSTEPEREIEKSLRAYANRRRQQAGTPPDMHPATRKILQGEVTRHAAQGQEKRGFWQLLWGSWPRITATVSTAAALLILGVFLLPGLWRGENGREMLLAQKEGFRDEAGAKLKQQGFDTATRQAESAKDDLAKTISEPVPTTAPKPTPVTPAITLPVTVSAPARGIGEADVASGARPAAMASTATLSAQRRSDSESNSITHEFVRVAPVGPAQAGGGQGVLNSFKLEQRGNQVRVIDSDGSVYSGSVTTNITLAGGDRNSESNQVAREGFTSTDVRAQSAQITAAGTNYSFEVRGTNLTLNQPVFFTGNFALNESLATSQPEPFARGGGGGGRAGGRRGNAQPQTGMQLDQAAQPAATPAQARAESNVAQTVRLQGQVIVGTNRARIEAMPTRR